jgi:apolipoprotein N-acyltransferase
MERTTLKDIHIQHLFLSCISGLLLTAAFPDIELSWLAWIALIPLLISLDGRSPKSGFRLGFIFGIVHYLSLMYWLVHTLMTFGHLPVYLSVPLLFLLAAYMAIYPAIFSAAFSWAAARPPAYLFFMPAIWAALEYIRSFFLSGFPWEFLGYSQYRWLTLIQIADITGVYGVSFLILSVNIVGFLVWRVFSGSTSLHALDYRRAAAGGAAVSVLLVLHTLGYGQWRTLIIDKAAAKSPASHIAVVQGNVDQSIKWNPAFQIATTEKYITLSKSAAASHPDLIVWPETAAPFYFLFNKAPTEIVLRGVRETGTSFLIGSPSFIPKSEDLKHADFFNSAFLIDPSGHVTEKYDKVHLVPFGEYVPLQQWFPFIGKIVEEVGDFKGGQKGQTLNWGKFPLGIQICYEMIFPDLSREMARNHAAFLINMTNDAWYGKTSAPYQHFSMAVFRAIENRRSLIRSANTGISGFIDPVGRILAATPLFEDAVITRSLPALTIESFYTRYGDVFAWICTAISALFLFMVTNQHRYFSFFRGWKRPAASGIPHKP